MTARGFACVSIVVLAFYRAALAADPVPFGGPTGVVFTFNASLSDEFNGSSLDLGKWTSKSTPWRGRWPAFNMPENSQVSDGSLQQTMKTGELPSPVPLGTDPRDKTRKPYQFSTGFIMSTALSGYGYYEARIKSAHVLGVSGFWLDKLTTPMSQWEEIDIVCQRGTLTPKYAVFAAHSAAGSVAKTDPYLDYKTSSDLTAGYHVYGLAWTADTLTWYIDGVQCYQAPNTRWHNQQRVMFDLEADPIYVEDLPDPKTLPKSMRVDYFRFWTMTAAQRPL